jgi:hypothetical protein
MQDAMGLRAKGFRVRMRYVVAAALAVALAAGAGTGLFLALRGGDGESIRVVTGVQFPYPQGWTEQPLADVDRSAGLMLKLERERPDASFLARTVIARLAADFDINGLAGDTEAALSAEIEGFDLVSRDVTRLGPYDAVRISYRQSGDGADHQTLMVIVPTPNQTFYLTLRAEKAQFRQIESDGSRIINDFVTYVSSVD